MSSVSSVNGSAVGSLYHSMVESPTQSLAAVRDPSAADLLRIERALAGDLEAFGDLVSKAWPELVRLARVALAGSPEAEDAAQQALFIAWRHRTGLRSAKSFRSWLRRIVWREALKAARRQGRRQRVEDARLVEARTADPTPRIEVARLLAALPARQRAVLHLSEVEGLSAVEIARELGLAAATVRVHRWQALRRLRRLLEDER